MPRPCSCDNVPPAGRVYATAYCRKCWLWHHSPKHRAKWGGESPPPSPAACVHRGATLALVDCPSCRGTVKAKVLACALHGQCTQFAKPLPGVRPCAGCPDATPPTVDLLPGIPDPVQTPERWPIDKTWAELPATRQRHVEALRHLLTLDFPPPARAEGDGVVFCGGGRYWPGLVAAVRMLREVSDLPVQVWHRGKDEPVTPADLEGVPGVTFHDATSTGPHRCLRKWEIKTIALLNCGLRRVLFLDADAYPVEDPAVLLELASAYRFAYWQDSAENLKWSAFGVPGAVGGRVPPVQGGQLAIDLVTFRRELVLAHWLNQHSDYSHRHGYGDQDTWRVALALTGGSYHCLGRAEWCAPGYLCRHGGEPLVVHRVNCKLGIDAEGPQDFPREGAVQAHFARPCRAAPTRLKELVRPVEIEDELLRLGKPHDGGYVVNRSALGSAEVLYSYGVGYDTSFEADFAARTGRPVHLYDHTVSLERVAGGMTFHPEPLYRGSFASHLYANGDGGKRILLKIDVEGDEHDWAAWTDVAKLRNVVAILMEVHGLDTPEAARTVSRLRRHYDVAWVHPNNCTGTFRDGPDELPLTLEMLFVRKGAVGVRGPSGLHYPLPIDQDNHPELPPLAVDYRAGLSLELLPGVADPVRAPERHPYDRAWAGTPAVTNAHLRAYHKLLSADLPPPEICEGDGIVMCAGGKYWPSAVVGIRMIRRVSDLPVQVWLGGAESAVCPEQLAGVPGVTYRRVEDVRPALRTKRGWDVKLTALLHCGFRRALLLDSDCYPVADPGPFLDLATAHRIAYWQDFPYKVDFAKLGLPNELHPGDVRMQTGQIAVDRLQLWREIVLAHWWCQHADYAFNFTLGDQECLLAPVLHLGGDHKNLGKPDWVAEKAFVCNLGGAPLFVHRVHCKFGVATERIDELPFELQAHYLYQSWAAAP